ncbi:MAG: TlpA disulfide reductase family protein [Solirubrobacteraceae bacterium]
MYVKRILGPAASIAVAAALLALFVFGLAKQSDNRSLDQAVISGKRPPAPNGSLPLLDAAGSRSLAAYRGRVVVLNFWASWCGPCADEAALLQHTQQQLQQRGSGTVLGVAYEDNTPDSLNFERRHAITYPSLRDASGTLAQKYGTKALPETFVLDRLGRVVAISRGQITQQAFLDKAIARAQQP